MLQRIDYPSTGDVLYSGTAANGLRIRVLPRKGFSGFYAVFATSYGGVHLRFSLNGETYDTPAGVAHYLEHKMFDLPDGDNALRLLSQNGADPNAFTSSDVTCYYFHCTRAFEDNLRMLLHFVSMPYFTEETVAKEQGIIAQEIRMGEDSPGSANYYSLLKLLYARHPIREKTIGTVESISRITAETLYTCHRAFYSPANMVLCVAGDLDPEQILALVEEELPAGESTAPLKDVPSEESLLPIGTFAELEMPVATPQFLIGAKIAVRPKGPDYLKQQLIADLALRLLAGPSSPFYNRLYADGLLSRFFDADADFTDGAGHAILGGESRNPQAVLEALKAELKRIESEGLSRKLFHRAQKAAIGGVLRSMEDFDDVCVSLALDEFDGFCYLDYPAVLESVTIGECEAFLKETLSPDRLAMSVVHAGRTESC
ncbi:MAG: insulinase family protein [Oscillospiraceae bacterium]|nr:insulinase family protein [Oscillospiraceae bacterium]